MYSEEDEKLRRNVRTQLAREQLRDQFAMAALQGLCSKENGNASVNWIVNRHRMVAADAYAYADAMLAARFGQNQKITPEHPADEDKSLHHNGDADGWINWHGGERPVDSNMVIEVKLRDGRQLRIPGGHFRWSHETDCPGGDIVAYRVVRP